MTAPSSSVTRSTKPRSTVPSLRAGVPTETRTTSASCAEAARSDDTRSRSDSLPAATSSSSPGSTIGLTPRSSGSSLCGSMSTPTTVCPSFERHAAVTAPTYPRPTTTTFIREAVLPSRKGRTDTLRQGKVPETPGLNLQAAAETRREVSTSRSPRRGMPSIVAMTLRRCVCSMTPLRASSRRLRSAGGRLPQCGSRSCRLVKVGGNEIDIALYADVLRRHRAVVLVGVALTVALAVLSYVRVSPSGISYRSPEIWSNQATLVLTQEGRRS